MLLESKKKSGQVVFHLHDVSKVYTRGEVTVQALKQVDLDLYADEFVVLLNPSGSGST